MVSLDFSCNTRMLCFTLCHSESSVPEYYNNQILFNIIGRLNVIFIFLNVANGYSLFIRVLVSHRTVTGKYRFCICCQCLLCAALFHFINLFLQIISNRSLCERTWRFYSNSDNQTEPNATPTVMRKEKRLSLECKRNEGESYFICEMDRVWHFEEND